MEIAIVIVIVLVAFLATGGAGLGSLMGNLSAQDIAGYASNAGWNGSDLTMAVAIALAESSGRPGAVGDVPIGGSVGLWQIYTKMHPEFAGQDLTDPQTNANAAYQIYQRAGGFTPWTTYNNIAKGITPNASQYFDEASVGVTAMQQQQSVSQDQTATG